MSDKPVVMISSTSRDLPEYREQVKNACLRVSMFPKMMEQLPSLDADAIKASLDMVDEADIYIGLFAHRYGYVPEGHSISITEMEYKRAVERGIPRLIFLMSEDVLVLPKNVDKGEKATKLEDLKGELKKKRVVTFFETPKDLRGLVVHSLEEVKKKLAAKTAGGKTEGEILAANIHYISAIPPKPEAYIAHPYTLLQVRGLIGRKKELEILTDWVTKPQYKDIKIFNVVAIGGMGKSALTWTWFNDIAPQEMTLAGRVWWSFYESDASFENFITRTLAYVSGSPLESVKKLSMMDQQNALLRRLDEESHLLVLDGLERILIAYARQDAAYLMDDTALDEETANQVAGAIGLPQSAGKAFIGKHRLRKTADVRVGQFLRKLTRVRNSRILISTRLYPADLQIPTSQPSPNCYALFLRGLSDQDALDLWRAYGAKGSREVMLPVFNSFGKHPLLLQLLAYEVANFRDAPGDFDAWQKANPDFNPFNLPLVQVQSHVLAYALKGISPAELRTLQMIAGFRMPAGMETIKALLIQDVKKSIIGMMKGAIGLLAEEEKNEKQPFASIEELDHSLTILEDRGLLGWDRKANRYDLHPIVRGVIWSALKDTARNDIYGSLRSHFEAMPVVEETQIESVEDLSPAIELYNSLIELGHFDEAYIVFRDRLNKAALYRLSANRLRMELLERLFPDGSKILPQLKAAGNKSVTLGSLAQAYELSGQPGEAILLYKLADEIDVEEGDQENHSVNLCNMAGNVHHLGYLYQAEYTARTALPIARNLKNRSNEGISLCFLGNGQAIRRAYEDAKITLCHSLSLFKKEEDEQLEGVVTTFLAENTIWRGDFSVAKVLADRAWELAGIYRYERDFIRAARLQGSAALGMGDLDLAAERLHHALTRARAVQLVEQELPILIALAELSRQQNKSAIAREHLEEVWESAERGPYPLFHADALNVLAQIERDADHKEAAIEAATEAYRKAWCDGPPYAYHYGLENAKKHLAALGAPEPEMPPFDPSKFEPMPEVEINPSDEFGGEEGEE